MAKIGHLLYCALLVTIFVWATEVRGLSKDDYSVYYNNKPELNIISFGFRTKDDSYRFEEGFFPHNGTCTVIGNTRWIDPLGRMHNVRFEADHSGFKIIPEPAGNGGGPVLQTPVSPRDPDLDDSVKL